ncbi:unnamed protein product [Nyctereutes procyonoides]|uniref:Procathepsin L n=1 Tax=Nyctereutes procyonoides TaxID=34880 RepID=A0A811ZYW8_NYCPR|nr:unnamed protein product [Nyctereutes procyonoides]
MHRLYEYSQGKHGFTMAMNTFGDMTNEEFRQVMNDFQNQKHKKGKVFQEPIFAEIPKSVDWREKGYVTPVQNQGQCGSCWTFRGTGALKGQMFRKMGKLVPLSEQNLVDCSKAQGNEGCNGGLMDNTFQHDTETCNYKTECSAANDTGFMDLPQWEKTLMKAVATLGPISVATDAGISNLDHGVLVAGYGFEGTDSNNKFWIIKNNQNNHCGIATATSYPIV